MTEKNNVYITVSISESIYNRLLKKFDGDIDLMQEELSRFLKFWY